MSVYLANQPDPDAVAAALASESVIMILLLEMQFTSGTIYLSNHIVPFTDIDQGHTWHGMGNLVGVEDLSGAVGNLAPILRYSLGVPWEFLGVDDVGVNGMGTIAGMMGAPGEYLNRTAILYEQVLSNDRRDEYGRRLPVGIPSALHFGLMDRPSARFTPRAAMITMSVEGPLARKGAPNYGMLTSRDQLRRHPGDNGLSYVPEVLSTNPKWTDW